jgi:hypothetical protein
MYIDDLISVFQNTTKDIYPQATIVNFVNELKNLLEKKKYDLQDQTIIERILNEDLESFTESFDELLKSSVPAGEERTSFFEKEDGGNIIIDLFIKSVEHSIDYFYNDIISKQFSGK